MPAAPCPQLRPSPQAASSMQPAPQEEGGQGKRAGALIKDRGIVSGSLMPDRKGHVHVSTRPAHTKGRGYEGDTEQPLTGCRPPGTLRNTCGSFPRRGLEGPPRAPKSEGNPLKSRRSLRSQQRGGVGGKTRPSNGKQRRLRTGSQSGRCRLPAAPGKGAAGQYTHMHTYAHTHVDIHMHTCVQ